MADDGDRPKSEISRAVSVHPRTLRTAFAHKVPGLLTELQSSWNEFRLVSTRKAQFDAFTQRLEALASATGALRQQEIHQPVQRLRAAVEPLTRADRLPNELETKAVAGLVEQLLVHAAELSEASTVADVDALANLQRQATRSKVVLIADDAELVEYLEVEFELNALSALVVDDPNQGIDPTVTAVAVIAETHLCTAMRGGGTLVRALREKHAGLPVFWIATAGVWAPGDGPVFDRPVDISKVMSALAAAL